LPSEALNKNKRKTMNDKIKRASTFEKNSSLNEFSPQESSSGSQERPTKSTRVESLDSAVRVRIPRGLKEDVKEIVMYLGLWSNEAEFIREVIRSERNRWIEEARKKKEQFEKEEVD
jgi:hypothetical protein